MRVLLAALYWAILPQRGLRFAPPSALREISGGATMALSWGRSAYSPPLGAPTLRCAPPQSPKNASQIHPNRCGAEYPTIWAPLLERPGPIGVGDWSELCIASGTFRETMGQRTGVSALRNPGGAQPDVQ
jgi:hypothetical protein